MTQVIFCDLDGVIRHWDNQTLFDTEEKLGVPKSSLGKARLIHLPSPPNETEKT